MSKYLFLTIFLILCKLYSNQLTPKNYASQYGGSETLENAINDNYFGIWSIDLFNLSDSTQHFSHNSDLHLIPASNQKLVTTSAALEILGEDYQYSNQLYYSGSIKDSILNGDLYIYSNGDPTIGKDYFKSKKEALSTFDSLAIYLKDTLGIEVVTGDLYLPNILPLKARYGKGWELDDLPNYYAAPITNYSFNENVVKVLVRNNKIVTDPYYEFNFNRLVDSGSRCKLYRVGNSSDIDIISDFKGSYRKFITAPNPEQIFKEQLLNRLRKSGIDIHSKDLKIKRDEKLLYTFYSDSLELMLKKCNNESNNFFSEQIFRTTAKVYRNSLDSLFEITKQNDFYTNRENSETFEEITSTLFNLDIEPADGSGLSRYNQLTSHEIIEILKFMYKSKRFPIFLSTLAKPGYDGTLESKFISRETSQKIFGKTGSMTNVFSFSGYLVTNSGKNIAFSFINNNSQGSKRKIRDLIMGYLERVIILN